MFHSTQTDAESRSHKGGWLGSLEGKTNPDRDLERLSEAMTDPFTSTDIRLRATLASYCFTSEPRSLIDWAIVQTSLQDPMSRFTRHELEQGFRVFARNREQHLQELVNQLKREGHKNVLHESLQASRLPAGRSALAQAMKR